MHANQEVLEVEENIDKDGPALTLLTSSGQVRIIMYQLSIIILQFLITMTMF